MDNFTKGSKHTFKMSLPWDWIAFFFVLWVLIGWLGGAI